MAFHVLLFREKGKININFLKFYWSVRATNRMGGDNGGGIVILARCKFDFIREYENLVYRTSNNISNVTVNTLNFDFPTLYPW